MAATLDGNVTTWMGRDIETLSREELIAALHMAVRQYHDHLNSSIRSMALMRELHVASRG